MEFLPICKPLVDSTETGAFLRNLVQHVRAMRVVPASEHLSSFLGFEANAGDYQANRIDHVAVYAGDYRNDEEFETWLDNLLRDGALSNVQTGPSYIAPREYRTQGYWISAELEGAGLEIFTLKHGGDWEQFSPAKKSARMSHIALGMECSSQVLPLLTRLSQHPHISVLSYSPNDELNHTYGHLLNKDTNNVLEIVHASMISPAAGYAIA